MTTTVSFSFPWGRYHGTPWGRNVNEGVVDWPPAPWRILRAFYATWKNRVPDLDEDVVNRLFDKLAEPPSYEVPQFSIAHTRHYMPDHKHKSSDTGNTDKVIDTFVLTERGASLVVRWPVDLGDDELSALGRLCESLSYLGRAESLCMATIGAPQAPLGSHCSVSPLVSHNHDMIEELQLLSATSPLELRNLEVRPSELRRKGRIDPPGSRWIRYPAPSPSIPNPRPARRPMRRVTAVRYAIAAPALPARTAAVVLGDVLRQAAMSRHGDRQAKPSIALSGKEPTGARRSDQHQHAHYLAFAGEGAQRGWELLDTLVVWAPGGLGPADVDSLVRVDRLWGRRHIESFRPCRLGVEAVGQIDHVAPELCGPAAMWESFTPFAPSRHGRPNRPWDDHAITEVARELRYRGLPAPEVRLVQPGAAARSFTQGWLDFRRYRASERIQDGRRATGLRLIFDEPVDGPLCLGALSHFGLGLFLPVDGHEIVR